MSSFDRSRPLPPRYRSNNEAAEESTTDGLQEYIHMQDFIRSGTSPPQKGGVTDGSWRREQDEGSDYDHKSSASIGGHDLSSRAPSLRTFDTSNQAVQFTDGRGDSSWSHQQPKETPLSELPLSEKELTRIMWKIDVRLIPVLMFISFYTILDMSALVHAKIAGMSKILHMNDEQYHIALVMYNISHMIFVLPAMWCMDRFGSKRWLSILVFTGGIFMLCTGFVQTPIQMIIMRFILGGLEAGMLPACLQTITLMYPRKSVQWRMALCTTGGTIGGLVGSFIAFGLTDIHIPNKHIQGWRMIFIIEGAITIIAAPITYLMMPDSIDNCTYLSSSQKVQYQIIRSRNANQANLINMSFLQKLKLFTSPLAEIKSWMAFLIMMTVYIPFLGLTINLPVMMKFGFGYNARDSQILPIPIKIITAVLLLLLSWFSDRLERRILFVVGPAAFGLVGFLGALMATNGKTRYGMMFLGDLVHVALPGAQMILAQNIVCDTKRGAALGIGGFIAGLSSIIASYLIWDKDAPRYFTAYSVMASCCAMVLTSGGLLYLYLKRENRIKQQTIDSRSVDHMSKEELRALGDKNPFFLFKY